MGPYYLFSVPFCDSCDSDSCDSISGEELTMRPHTNMRPSISIAAFVVSSLFASLIGKLVVTRFFFDYPVVILLLQNATSLFILECLRILKIVKLDLYSIERGRHVLVPSVLMCMAQWLTVSSFEGIGLPIFDAVKRFTPLAILGASAIFRQDRLDKGVLGAVVVVCLTSFIAVNFEMQLERFSFFYGGLACILQGLAYVKFEQLSRTYLVLELLYVHTFNSLLVFLFINIAQEELRDAFAYLLTSTHPPFTSLFLLLLLSALSLQYATFLCIEKHGALNTQIISNVRSCLQIYLAYFTSFYHFYDVGPVFFNFRGLICIFPVAYYYLTIQRNHQSISKTPRSMKDEVA